MRTMRKVIGKTRMSGPLRRFRCLVGGWMRLSRKVSRCLILSVLFLFSPKYRSRFLFRCHRRSACHKSRVFHLGWHLRRYPRHLMDLANLVYLIEVRLHLSHKLSRSLWGIWWDME